MVLPAWHGFFGSLLAAMAVSHGLELRIMPLGASITAGQSGNVLTNGYRAPLQELLRADGWEEVGFVGSQTSGDMVDNHHEGYPGIRTAGLASQTRSRGVVEQFAPNLVLLNVGTNDCSQGINGSEARRLYSDMIDAVLEPAGGARLLVVSTLLPRRDADANAAVRECTLAFNDQVRDLVSTHARAGSLALADMHTGFITLDDLADTLHPTAAGYAKMAQVWRDAIEDNVARLVPPV